MKKSFHYLWISQLFANLGDVFYIVGLISILYQASESPFYMALLPFLNMAGRMISSSFAPLLFNRYRLKQLLVISQALKTILLLILAVGSLYTLSLSFMLIIIFAVAFLDGFAQPASTALIPRIVENSQLLRANGTLSMLDESTRLGGWALGGILVAATSGGIVIWMTLFLFILSTFFILFVTDNTRFERKLNVAKKQELTEGFKLIWDNHSFRTIHVMIILESIANVVWVAAIMYLFVADVLHVSEAWWGYINTTFFIGLIIGGFIFTKFDQFFERNLKNIVLFSSVAVAIVMLLFGLNQIAIVALILSLFFGVFDQFKGILLGTWLQLKATDEQLVKVYSAQGVLTSLLFGLSTLLAGTLATIFSVQWLFIGSGLILLLSAIYFGYVQKRFV
ncbi:MFS transporter [Solibacillus isronensis]|uniref:MFS transporter n=1 Tax=Solibacillus isronensis TaxID=412383 RepID=UPI00203AF2CC|nr:MFS transporter [Solibacillus isronensis]MCM3721404.1 MFS transporter [Solibacillus isronensis]